MHNYEILNSYTSKNLNNFPLDAKKFSFFAFPRNPLQILVKKVDFLVDYCIMQSKILIAMKLCIYGGEICEEKDLYQNDKSSPFGS